MGRHRAAGQAPAAPPPASRRPAPHETPRRAARLAAEEEARRQRRAERARRRQRSRARRARHTSLPLGQRLLALPWVTFVLLALVAVAVAGLLRPVSFEGRSTVTAATPAAAAQAAVALTRVDLTRRVEQQVELERELRGSLEISVDRPEGSSVVVVNARAPDPRLAALAADTAAALVVADDADLTFTSPAVVPTGPVGGPARWPWALAGAAALVLAAAVERSRDRHERADDERSARPNGSRRATLPGATTAPVTTAATPRRSDRALFAGGVR